MCCIDPIKTAITSFIFKHKRMKRYSTLLGLPITTLLKDKTEVTINAMTDAQTTQTYNMIQEVSSQGQGFGDDSETEEKFRVEMRNAHQFSILSEKGDLLGSFILSLSRYARGVNVADIYIIVQEKHRNRTIGRLCLQLSEIFAKKLGYIGLYIDAYGNNAAMLKVVNIIGGYKQVGSLPTGALLSDGTIVANLVFYKDLRTLSVDEDFEKSLQRLKI